MDNLRDFFKIIKETPKKRVDLRNILGDKPIKITYTITEHNKKIPYTEEKDIPILVFTSTPVFIEIKK